MHVLSALVAALAAAHVVLASPHSYRHIARHHAIVARNPVPVIEQPPVALMKRQSTGRKCRQRGSSLPAAPAAAPTSSAALSSQAAPPPPPPSPTPAPAPAPSSPPPAPPAPSAPAPAPPAAPIGAAPGGFLAGLNNGDGTFYDAGLGSCGFTNGDNDMIAAIGHAAYDAFPGATANPNLNPICGRKVRAHFQGQSVDVTVVDRCGGCDMTSLDFSKAAFSKLTNGNMGAGRIKITWNWL